ncbi:MAG: histidine phosphatase family protein [Bacteroidetes bacterium]|nr:histidine phosphatase family protein [Bacteroidota bacterium]
MKTLFLVRHAKSSWDAPGLADDQRSLLTKGVTKTRLVADYLIKEGVKIDLMISSQAVRAYETAKIIAACLEYPVKHILQDRKIYDGPYDRLLDLIYGTSNDVNSLMIIGHNPLITQLSNLFLHPGIDDMPTSAVVCITFKTGKWEEIPASKSEMKFFIYPKLLKQPRPES